MPVAGLPTALDSALEALLTENAVSSWNISAEGRKTTAVLRLVTTTDPDMADFTHPNTATQHFRQHFRRKPPSQVRRDQRRTAERTRQNPEASEHSPSGLFQPTPPPTTTVAAHPTHVLHALLTTVHRPAVGPVTQTVCRCHASASPWISLWKTSWRGKDKVKLKLYKTVLISLRKGLFSVATIWRRAEIMLAV